MGGRDSCRTENGSEWRIATGEWLVVGSNRRLEA
jgi:hypothetical protein